MCDGHSASVRKRNGGVSGSRNQSCSLLQLVGEIRRCRPVQTLVHENSKLKLDPLRCSQKGEKGPIVTEKTEKYHKTFTSKTVGVKHPFERQIPRFYRAMHFSAKRGIAIVCCPSVRLSVRLSVTIRYRDHIGWKSSKIISRPNSLGLCEG